MAEYTLPCGYFDPQNDDHPDLCSEIELREMTGYEEDILGDKSKKTTSIDEVMSRCLVRLGGIIRKEPDKRDKFFEPFLAKMMSPDRTFLMIRLRQLSLGTEFIFEAVCPDAGCRHRHPRMVVDLDSLAVKQMEDPTIRHWTVTTPSGLEVTYRALYGADERKLLQIRKQQGDNFFSQLLMLRLTEINGEKARIPVIKQLSVKDRDFLRGKFDESEGGIDTQIELTCDECGNNWKMALPIGASSFFFPAGISS